MVTLGAVKESYDNLVFKTIEGLRWAYKRVSFGVLLKTDDDSMVHVSRLWSWLETHTTTHELLSAPRSHAEDADPSGSLLYAGRLQVGSQTIRPNFNRSSLWHPAWFPDDFLKWAVPVEAFADDEYPPHCSGGGYLLGRRAVSSVLLAYSRRKLPVIHLEDVFVGVLANQSGLHPVDLSPHFQDIPRGSAVTVDTFAGRMLVHRVSDPLVSFPWMVGTKVPGKDADPFTRLPAPANPSPALPAGALAALKPSKELKMKRRHADNKNEQQAQIRAHPHKKQGGHRASSRAEDISRGRSAERSGRSRRRRKLQLREVEL